MNRDRCYVTFRNGFEMRVHGDKPPSRRTLDALAEVAVAAFERLDLAELVCLLFEDGMRLGAISRWCGIPKAEATILLREEMRRTMAGRRR